MLIVSPKFMNLICKVAPIDPYAITLWPFILCIEQPDLFTLNHESIHLAQQKELLILGFYVLYLFFYVKNLLAGMDGPEAYSKIPFEEEAHSNQRDLDYLPSRKSYACLRS